jgi:hypothetical protein
MVRVMGRQPLKHKRVVNVTTRFAKAGIALTSAFLFLLDFNDFTTFVESAVGTNGVWQTHGAAVGAGGQVMRLQGVVRAAHVAAALRVFALWMWGHVSFSLNTIARAMKFAPVGFQFSGLIISAG